MIKENTSKKLVVLFPGKAYSVDCPLLYYARMKYEMAGYEVLAVESYGVKKTSHSLESYGKIAIRNMEKQFAKYDFSKYEEIVFVSKSMGTVIAPWLEDRFSIAHVTHVLLTPIRATLPFLTEGRKVKFMVSGTEDKLVDILALQKICNENQLPLMVVEGVGHRLEATESVERNMELIRRFVELM